MIISTQTCIYGNKRPKTTRNGLTKGTNRSIIYRGT